MHGDDVDAHAHVRANEGVADSFTHAKNMSSDSESDGQLDSRAAVAVREDDTEKDSADVGGK